MPAERTRPPHHRTRRRRSRTPGRFEPSGDYHRASTVPGSIGRPSERWAGLFAVRGSPRCGRVPAALPWAMSYKVGDVVRLKSGGPKMTVAVAKANGQFEC